MYATCIFCHGNLGRNEAIEHFPLGRRLAYDPARGRLWVVCRHCERWNLSPLESRWEAIDEAERAYRGTPLRASTSNIGLARLRDGLELVRIGDPPRIEFAGWRYGDQFDRRRRRNTLLLAGGVTAALIPAAASMAGLAVAAMALATGDMAYRAWSLRRAAVKVIAVVECDDGGTVDLTRSSFGNHALEPRWDGNGWRLHIAYRSRRGADGSRVARMPVTPTGWFDGTVALSGPSARRVLAMLMPVYNALNGGQRKIADALELVGASTSLDQMLHRRLADTFGGMTVTRGGLNVLPASARLAIEMVLHDDDERRALEGEMHLLEARWREAEVVAAISDGLLLPAGIDRKLSSLRGEPGAT